MASLDVDAWQLAILEKFQSIEKAGRWTVHDISGSPAGRQAVSSKCLFQVKHNADGSVE